MIKIKGNHFMHHDGKAEARWHREHPDSIAFVSCYTIPTFWIWQKNYWKELYYRFKGLFQKKISMPC